MRKTRDWKWLSGVVLVGLATCSFYPSCALIDKLKDSGLDDITSLAELDSLDIDSLYAAAVAKFGEGDPKSEDWQTGAATIEVPRLIDCSWEIRLRNHKLDRPESGEAERMGPCLEFSGDRQAKLYFMPGGRDCVRFRYKAATNGYHCGDWILKPIPRDETTWRVVIKDRKLDLTHNGQRCVDKHGKDPFPLDIGDAELKTIKINYDPDRDMGAEWIAGEVVAGEGE